MSKIYTNNTKIIVVTKNFGVDFTGATIATCRLVSKWSNSSKEIIIITKNVGSYDKINNLKIIKCKNNIDLIKQIRKFDNSNIFYTDDHLAILCKFAKREYYHTYHASWPEARWNNFSFFVKSFVFIPLYKLAIKNSKKEFTVSNRYLNWVKKYNLNSRVIRNGIDIKVGVSNTIDNDLGAFRILMLGNIDGNKYLKAIELFDEIEKLKLNLIIDIYGTILDERIYRILLKYKFVNIKGFSKKINMKSYNMLLNTSKNENLSMSVCEAIYQNIPVVAFNIGALNEIVIHGDNGFLIDKLDTCKMAKVIKLMNEKSINLKFKSDVIKEFDWITSANKYLQEFK